MQNEEWMYQRCGGANVCHTESCPGRICAVESVRADLADLVARRYRRSPDLHPVPATLDFEGSDTLVRTTTSRIVGFIFLHAFNGGADVFCSASSPPREPPSRPP